MRAVIQKYLSHPAQAFAIHVIFLIVRMLPFNVASAIGGFVARLIGPMTKTHGLARDNLTHAFPEKTTDEINKILTGVWDNVGRTAFEIPHVPTMNVYDNPERFEIVNADLIDQLRDDGKCGVIFSGHLANWEFSPHSAAQRTPPLYVDLVYRAPDNPWVKSIFDKRKPDGCRLIPKGLQGARQAMKSLQEGRHLALLVDQKMNDGISVPFFGRDAMTAPAIAQFALKFDCPLIPMRIERIEKTKFRLTYYPALEMPKSGNRQEDIQRIMADVNNTLESWIREKPDQWLWVHRRWPKD
ncbi:MAG: lauroyl acyltransferase [Methylocystaceae bacterium]|nr:lauroyl acyltransferase [Methylocystaceae bacterium]